MDGGKNNKKTVGPGIKVVLQDGVNKLCGKEAQTSLFQHNIQAR